MPRSTKVRGRPKKDLGNWPEMKARYLAECERLGLPPQTTLAREMGVSRQRAEQILNHDRGPGKAIPVIERLLDAARLFKPKPKPVDLKAERREQRKHEKMRIANLVTAVEAMSRGYGNRGVAAREIGITQSTLSLIVHGRRGVGPKIAARLSAWVERRRA